ncbi:hypothetical protein BJF89_13960 [Corynebacterium sp. CNJ-954]|uniref:hypothetical protein n=1 Tax=Corynebacterium sp. CNJ-954 TaxID=1904962 RepID=UPI00096043D2|nr:hypothetical protein [Corynebacterium sp. CNJ-954]OLT55925.1 hypothetical protein BJF89_13960 [Corynebacterium sp. CNJ-954]
MQSYSVAPPAQAVVVKALGDALGVRVSTQKPRELGDRYVIISRIGGSSLTFATSDPRFLVECYAPTEYEAEAFAEQVAAAWRVLRSGAIVWGYDDRNIVPNADPDTSHYRFQFTGGVKIKL